MNVPLLTLVHVALSVVALLCGALLLGGLLAGIALRLIGRTFLAATAAMLITGFLFPFAGVTPAVAVGGLCVPILGVAGFSVEAKGLDRVWARAYAASVTALVYFNTLVLAAQLFLKIPVLRELAPTQSSPYFIAAQTAILAGAVGVGIAVWRRGVAPAAGGR